MGERSNTPDSSPPTMVRWRIVVLMMAFAAMSHFNRISMTVAGNERIMKESELDPTTRIDPRSMGVVYSSYLVMYTLLMTPGGLLIDRRGPKFALVLMGLGSALFVALTALPGFLGLSAGMLVAFLIVVRGLAGTMSAPIHPAAARGVSYWLPFPLHATGNGLVTGAALLGIASTYYVFGKLMDLLDGWPFAFLIAGFVTAGVAALWLWYATDDPAQHPDTNDAERELLRQYAFTPTSAGERPILNGLGRLLCHRSLILLTISYAAVGYFEYLFFYWMQYYFKDYLALGTEPSRLYATITTLAMAAGIFAGGGLADWAEFRLGRRLGRSAVPVTGMLLSAVFLLVGLVTSEVWLVIVCFSVAMAAVGASEGPFWKTAIGLGGGLGGTSAAIFNTGGNLGGLLAPVVTPYFSHYFGWRGGFALASVFCLLGAILWAGIDPDQHFTHQLADEPPDRETILKGGA